MGEGGPCTNQSDTEHKGKTDTYNEVGRREMLQYWNSGSPVAHKALGVVAEKREDREQREGGGEEAPVKRTEGRAPAGGSEFSSKAAHYRGNSSEIAARLN
jgi:hypothetical protein